MQGAKNVQNQLPLREDIFGSVDLPTSIANALSAQNTIDRTGFGVLEVRCEASPNPSASDLALISNTMDAINSGRGRSDNFLRSTRRTPRRGTVVEASLARSGSSSTSVRINALDDIGALLCVDSVTYIVIMAVNLSFIVAGSASLAVHWGDEFCSKDLHTKWRWWVLMLIAKKALTTPAHMVIWKLSLQPEENRNQVLENRCDWALRWLELINLVFFVIGHVYLAQSNSCDDRWDSPIYQLAVALIASMYLRYVSPCVMVCCLAPAVCCCLPLVLWAMSRFYEQVLSQLLSTERADRWQDEINSLATVKFGEMANMDEEACPVCLADYKADDKLRKLPCGHAIHQPCVDSWLAVKPNCPICRAPCFGEAGVGESRV